VIRRLLPYAPVVPVESIKGTALPIYKEIEVWSVGVIVADTVPGGVVDGVKDGEDVIDREAP